METKKITKSLVLISIIAVIFNLARLDVWGTTNLLYLIWNLFLAWIPYLISLFFILSLSDITLPSSANRISVPPFLIAEAK